MQRTTAGPSPAAPQSSETELSKLGSQLPLGTPPPCATPPGETIALVEHSPSCSTSPPIDLNTQPTTPQCRDRVLLSPRPLLPIHSAMSPCVPGHPISSVHPALFSLVQCGTEDCIFIHWDVSSIVIFSLTVDEDADTLIERELGPPPLPGREISSTGSQAISGISRILVNRRKGTSLSSSPQLDQSEHRTANVEPDDDCHTQPDPSIFRVS